MCANPQVTAIEAALAAGGTVRAIAGQFGVSRSSLSRHRQHLDPPDGGAPPTPAGESQFEAAAHQLERAQTERERLRAQEGLRRALDLELRDFSRARAAIRAPDEDQLRALERNVEDAWAAYARVSGGSLDVSLRALSGVREAIAALRTATAKTPQDPIQVVLSHATGTAVSTWESDRATLGHYGIPEGFRSDVYRTEVHMSFGGGPDVLVYNPAGKLVWRKPGPPGERQPRRALPHEEPPGNGNGHH